MDARSDVSSEERRLPPSFHSDATSSIRMHHNPSHHHRGSSQSDGRDVHAQTPPQHHLQPRSSPAAASVDSFSSYINKDAPLFQNRSSSPRAEDQLRDHSDPASHAGSSPRPHPRHLVTTPIISRDAFRHQHWPEHDLSRSAANGVMSIEHLHASQLPRQHAEHADSHGDSRGDADVLVDDSNEMEAQDYQRQHAPASPSPAIDVNRLSASNLAQKDQEDDAAGHTFRNAHMRAPPSILADDSFESTASVMGEDAKNEIRRRRRTRPDEANLLAQVYAKNAFPDHETRLFLANRVGMSVRAVSVWFQNRRQAEKKRSGRYGGSGIAPTTAASTAASGQATPAVEESPVRPPVVPSQRKPLGNASANAAGPAKRFDPEQLKDLSSNNKENIPPWLAGREALEKIKREVPLAHLTKAEVVAPRAVSRDLRQAVGPEGVGITAQRVEVDAVPAQVTSVSEAASSSKTSLSRHRSVPRLSLDDVLSGRSKTLRRSATDHAAPLANASSEVEEEQLDTILPPPKLLSRASSSSSLSLLTTSGGRASIGSMDLRKEASPAPQARDAKASLTSSLPPKLTAALQRQGIIAMHVDDDVRGATGQGLLQMMPSSSASSSEADAFYGANDQRRDGEEDEERTLKMIAQRRAAKAQATALAKAQEARERAAAASKNGVDACRSAAGLVPMDPGCADARQAIVQQSASSSSSALDASIGSVPKKGSAAVVGLAPARQLSLDWAAGRDRASTSALSASVGGTPLSRSVSARQLSTHRPSESTPLSQQRNGGFQRPDSVPTNGEKRKSGSSTSSRRSLSATDLTRRLQEAKRKGDTANRSTAARKRSAAAIDVPDENIDPVTTSVAPANAHPSQDKVAAQPAKRRRAALEDVAMSASLPEAALPPKFGASMASPMLSSRPFVPHASFPSASRGMPTMVVPSTPQSSSSLYGGIPLSTRSDRFRAIGASPATSLGRSISANYPSHRHALPRSSAARDQIGSSRGWDMAPGSHTRTYSQEESGWTPRSTASSSRPGAGESFSQPLPITASTPSRVLGDRTNFATPGLGHHGNSSADSPFMHDDSGFFDTMSDDEEHHQQQQQQQQLVRGKRPISPRKASLRNSGDDHQAAELLLGLGKTVGSRDSSLSQ